MAARFDRITRSIPQYYKPRANINWSGILNAIASEDDNADLEIINAREQLFVKTAAGQYLDALGSNVGISRFTIIKFIDNTFRQLIPILSFYPKQIKPSMYAALSLFWPTDYLHSTSVSTAFEPYNLVGGETLDLITDELNNISVAFLADNFATPGAATAQEVVDRINAWLPKYIKAFVKVDKLLNKKYVAISTNTFGLSGAVEITGGTANAILAFPLEKKQYTRVSLEEINANEIVVRIPKDLIVQFDDLRFAHRFHPNTTIVDGRPNVTAANPYWPGAFFYDRPGGSSISLFSTKALLQTAITKGNNYPVLTFDDVSHFPGNGGYISFNFGLDNKELSIKYLLRLNNTQLKIDATHTFIFDHIIGETVNLTDVSPVVTKTDGRDYPIYWVDTQISALVVGKLFLLLKAAGIIVRVVFTE